jgi:hypothetical protein
MSHNIAIVKDNIVTYMPTLQLAKCSQLSFTQSLHLFWLEEDPSEVMGSACRPGFAALAKTED